MSSDEKANKSFFLIQILFCTQTCVKTVVIDLTLAKQAAFFPPGLLSVCVCDPCCCVSPTWFLFFILIFYYYYSFGVSRVICCLCLFCVFFLLFVCFVFFICSAPCCGVATTASSLLPLRKERESRSRWCAFPPATATWSSTPHNRYTVTGL